ncbi:AEC family transporter [Povalibacter sp.]|uniref:AEC family transporter n=1 Tax=Povalibacter sp. TaxID=1962978 RepID=UPI002F42156E
MSNAILLALAPVFFVLALGYAAGKLRIVDNRQIDSLNALVMTFALPASLFVATASASRSEMTAQAPLFAIFGGVMLVVWAISYWFRRTVVKCPSADAALQALTIAYPNLAGVGLPIVSSVLGPSGAVPIAVALAAGSILVTPLTLIVVEMSSVQGRGNGRQASTASRILKALRRAVTKPVVIAPALGIAFSISGIELGSVAEGCLTLIGRTAAGVALFLTGLILSSQTFRLDAGVLSATAMADIVRPLLTAGIVLYLIPIDHETARTAILLGAIPSGFFGILFAVNYRLDSAAAGSMVLASTVFSIVTLAMTIALLFPH